MLTDKEIREVFKKYTYSFDELDEFVKDCKQNKGMDLTKPALVSIIEYSLKYAIDLKQSAMDIPKGITGFQDFETPGKGMVITDEIFFNKELCDVLRDVSMNSTLNVGDAFEIIQRSNDWERDIPIIKTLANSGYKPKELKNIIKALNQNISVRS